MKGIDYETRDQSEVDRESSMNPEIKKKWLEALRSGQYAQTKERLRDDSGYCCLGVLCDLYAKEKNVEWEKSVNAYGTNRYRFYNASGELPELVVQWAGVGNHDPILSDANDEHESETCSWANDNGGLSFAEIADRIEKAL